MTVSSSAQLLIAVLQMVLQVLFLSQRRLRRIVSPLSSSTTAAALRLIASALQAATGPTSPYWGYSTDEWTASIGSNGKHLPRPYRNSSGLSGVRSRLHGARPARREGQLSSSIEGRDEPP